MNFIKNVFKAIIKLVFATADRAQSMIDNAKTVAGKMFATVAFVATFIVGGIVIYTLLTMAGSIAFAVLTFIGVPAVLASLVEFVVVLTGVIAFHIARIEREEESLRSAWNIRNAEFASRFPARGVNFNL